MKIRTLINVFRNMLKKGMAFVILKKMYARIFEVEKNEVIRDNLFWIKKNCIDLAFFLKKIDPNLWEESMHEKRKIENKSLKLLANIECTLGGSGMYPFLYFLSRYKKCDYIVETGVATGFSSNAFLSAIEKNKKGILYSSDFPYFRISNPEQYIGLLVDKPLKANWNLFIKGDMINIPLILEKIPRIDIFHYDSDKRYNARENVFKLVKPFFHKDTYIIMDDIQDNSFFYDYINNEDINNWYIFEYEGKYVGVIGNFDVKY